MHSRHSSDSYPFQAKSSHAKRLTISAALALVLIISLAWFHFSSNDQLPHNLFSSSTPSASTAPAFNTSRYATPAEAAYNALPNSHFTSTLVIGTLERAQSKLTWLSSLTTLTSPPVIYLVDNATTAQPHLDRNRGREAAVYLKYIIEHYDTLHDVTIFWHPDETAWHNNMLLSLSSPAAIDRLSRAAVIRKGYVNARCDAWPGCPAWIAFNPSPAEHAAHPARMADGFSPAFFASKFPNDPPESIPRYFANACCSQFAVSRDAIHSRPREDYVRLYEWLADDIFDQFTGRMMEYLWPFIFTRVGEHCPDVGTCYCENFGVCLAQGGPEDMLHRSWLTGYRRAEELGDALSGMVLKEQVGAVERWREQRAKVEGVAKTVKAKVEGEGEQGKGEKDGEKMTKEEKEIIKAQEEDVRKTAGRKARAMDMYKKLKNDQWQVWGHAKECRKKLANMMDLKNGAGDQTMAGVDF